MCMNFALSKWTRLELVLTGVAVALALAGCVKFWSCAQVDMTGLAA